jgi:hypothetical protein
MTKLWIAVGVSILAAIFAAGIALAQDSPEGGNTQANITYNITELGVVEVLESWKGMKMEKGTYPDFSATRESGIIPVRVEDYSFAVSFATRSYLKREEGRVYFVTPDFYYSDSPLDVHITLRVPDNLAYVSSNVEAASMDGNTIRWELPGAVHMFVRAEFTQTSPFAPPAYPTGELFQVDPATLPELSADDIPRSPDEALKELETIIKMMQAQDNVDPDMVRVLRRSLSKFYYLFAVYGLVHEYQPPVVEESEE